MFHLANGGAMFASLIGGGTNVIARTFNPELAAEIIAFCKERIAGYKCPRSVDVRTEPFPLSGAGKVLKRELRRLDAQDGAPAEAKAG